MRRRKDGIYIMFGPITVDNDYTGIPGINVDPLPPVNKLETAIKALYSKSPTTMDDSWIITPVSKFQFPMELIQYCNPNWSRESHMKFLPGGVYHTLFTEQLTKLGSLLTNTTGFHHDPNSINTENVRACLAGGCLRVLVKNIILASAAQNSVREGTFGGGDNVSVNDSKWEISKYHRIASRLKFQTINDIDIFTFNNDPSSGFPDAYLFDSIVKDLTKKYKAGGMAGEEDEWDSDVYNYIHTKFNKPLSVDKTYISPTKFSYIPDYLKNKKKGIETSDEDLAAVDNYMFNDIYYNQLVKSFVIYHVLGTSSAVMDMSYDYEARSDQLNTTSNIDDLLTTLWPNGLPTDFNTLSNKWKVQYISRRLSTFPLVNPDDPAFARDSESKSLTRSPLLLTQEILSEFDFSVCKAGLVRDEHGELFFISSSNFWKDNLTNTLSVDTQKSALRLAEHKNVQLIWKRLMKYIFQYGYQMGGFNNYYGNLEFPSLSFLAILMYCFQHNTNKSDFTEYVMKYSNSSNSKIHDNISIFHF